MENNFTRSFENLQSKSGLIGTFDEHWDAVKTSYVYTERVHELGNGHVEVFIARADRFSESSEFRSYSARPQSEIDAANAERAARRAKSEVRRRCKAMGVDSLLTLTYRENQQDEALMKTHLQEFVRRLRRTIPDFIYVAAFERQKRGAWHVHLAVRRVSSHFMQKGVRVKSFDVIRAVWRSVAGALGGNIDMQKKRRNSKKTAAQLASYISKYMTKAYAEGEKHSQRYTCSRFKMPKPFYRFNRRENIKEIIARAVEKYAPAGTVIRSCFLDDCKGFFFTVEPAPDVRL